MVSALQTGTDRLTGKDAISRQAFPFRTDSVQLIQVPVEYALLLEYAGLARLSLALFGQGLVDGNAELRERYGFGGLARRCAGRW
jgi:hypothetical protein